MTRDDLLLIAEIGVNHDGDLDRAMDMVTRSARAGFDAVKFQYWNLDELLAAQAPNAAYQGSGDQRDLLAQLRLDLDGLARLRDRAHQEGLQFIATADGERACYELLALNMDALKIGSGDSDNPWLLDAAAQAQIPLIISLGMTRLDELDAILERIAGHPDVTLLHCCSAYPTALAEANLGRLRWLRDNCGYPVGLSDHTIGSAAAAAAVAMGSVIIEKHVTWNVQASGPDHAMSLPLSEAKNFVRTLRDLVIALRTEGPGAQELENRTWVRKGLYLNYDVPAGHVLSREDLVALRPVRDGMSALLRDKVVGRRMLEACPAGTLLTREVLSDDPAMDSLAHG